MAKKRHLVLYNLAGFCDSAKIAWRRLFEKHAKNTPFLVVFWPLRSRPNSRSWSCSAPHVRHKKFPSKFPCFDWRKPYRYKNPRWPVRSINWQSGGPQQGVLPWTWESRYTLTRRPRVLFFCSHEVQGKHATLRTGDFSSQNLQLSYTLVNIPVNSTICSFPHFCIFADFMKIMNFSKNRKIQKIRKIRKKRKIENSSLSPCLGRSNSEFWRISIRGQKRTFELFGRKPTNVEKSKASSNPQNWITFESLKVYACCYVSPVRWSL
jgi:hypothetical protein